GQLIQPPERSIGNLSQIPRRLLVKIGANHLRARLGVGETACKEAAAATEIDDPTPRASDLSHQGTRLTAECDRLDEACEPAIGLLEVLAAAIAVQKSNIGKRRAADPDAAVSTARDSDLAHQPAAIEARYGLPELALAVG